jgi:hypothetical protein
MKGQELFTLEECAERLGVPESVVLRKMSEFAGVAFTSFEQIDEWFDANPWEFDRFQRGPVKPS